MAMGILQHPLSFATILGPLVTSGLLLQLLTFKLLHVSPHEVSTTAR
jgi:hypothetical protein